MRSSVDWKTVLALVVMAWAMFSKYSQRPGGSSRSAQRLRLLALASKDPATALEAGRQLAALQDQEDAALAESAPTDRRAAKRLAKALQGRLDSLLELRSQMAKDARVDLSGIDADCQELREKLQRYR